MTDDIYQLAVAAILRHLAEARVPCHVDDGEVTIGSHRIGLSVSFDEFVEQGGDVIAPVDIQIHLDGDEGDRFRVGTLGVGATRAEAVASAVEEWHLLAAAPVLAALGAELAPRRPASLPQRLAGWRLFPGRIGLRGRQPAALGQGGPFLRELMTALHKIVSTWDEPSAFELRSIYILATCSAEGREVQAAVNGFVNQPLHDVLETLAWPRAAETYLYKQLFVLRGGE